MEVLKALGAACLALALASCELVSPASFAQTVSDTGITPLLVQSVETWGTVGGAGAKVVGFVGGGGRVWIITTAGFYGYDAQSLALVAAHQFPAVLPDDPQYSRFATALWNSAAFGASQLLWTRVTAPSGAGYATEILTIDTGAGTLTHADGDVPATFAVGNKAGTGWQLQADPTVHTFQFDAGAGPIGPVNSPSTMTYGNLQTSATVLFAISDSPAVKLGERRFSVAVQEWPQAVWGTASGPSTVWYTAELPPTFLQTSSAAPANYTFRVLKSPGHTFLTPTFGANQGNNTTTSVVALDDVTRKTVASQLVDDTARVAVDSGNGWFLLGPTGYNDTQVVSLPLRKYQW